MNKNVLTFIFVLLIGAGIAAFVIYMQARTPKYKWDTDYTKTSEQPYGLKYFYQLLKNQRNDIDLISTRALEQLDTTQTNSNIIAIDSYIEIDSININYLLNYIKKGNKVFFSSDESPTYLLERILPKAGSVYGYDQYESSIIKMNYASSQLPYPEKIMFLHKYLKTVKPIYWSGYYAGYFNSALASYGAVPISYFNDSIVNSFSISYGKGALIIHSNPIIFTNYNIIKKSGFKNASNMLSYLNNGTTYWNQLQYDKNANGSSHEENPLKFLFSHYALQTGWYVLLASILIFIVFRSKREQRIIPIIYQNKNTSIEYAKAIGSLYYQKKAHHNIANELYTIFLSDIRTRYNIITSYNEADLIEQIASRTEIKKEVLVDLFKLFGDVKYNVNATSKELVKLYEALENFNNIKK
jgi:hypothetical protein